MPDETFTRFEVDFVAGYIYSRTLEKYTGQKKLTEEFKKELLTWLDAVMAMIGHETTFEKQTLEEIEQLLRGEYGTEEG